MNSFVILLVLGLTAVTATIPATLTRQTKITGGNIAVISQYPSTAALLYSADAINFYQSCVGTIITTKSIVTAGHCLQGDVVSKWRVRVGSSWANSGGSVYNANYILIHPKFNTRTMDSDIGIIKTTQALAYSSVIRPISIAGTTYRLADNQTVWAVGYGASTAGSSEQLRHIQIWTINQKTCASRYGANSFNITSNMVCAGSINASSVAQCVGDSGGPLLHNSVLVGVYSWGYSCASAQYPGVNTRISSFTIWLQRNS